MDLLSTINKTQQSIGNGYYYENGQTDNFDQSLIMSIEAKLKLIEDENKKLSQLLQNFKDVNQSLDQKNSIQSQDLEKTQNQLSKKKQLLNEARNQINENKQLLSELNQANQELKAQNDKLTKKFSKLSANSGNLFKLELDLKSITKEKNYYQKQYETVNNQLQEIINELDEADKNSKIFKLQIDKIKNDSDQAIAFESKKNEKLQSEMAILMADNIELKQQLTSMHTKAAQLEVVETQILESEDFLQELKKQNKRKEKEYKEKLSRYKDKFKFQKESEFKDISEQYQEQLQDQQYEFQKQQSKLLLQVQRLTDENAQLKQINESQQIQKPREEIFAENELKQKYIQTQQVCDKNMKMLLLIASENERLHLVIEQQNKIIKKLRKKFQDKQQISQQQEEQKIIKNVDISKPQSSDKKRRIFF